MQRQHWNPMAGRSPRVQWLWFVVIVGLLGLALACAGSGAGSGSMPALVAEGPGVNNGAGSNVIPPPNGSSGGGTGSGAAGPTAGPRTSAFLFAGSGGQIWAGEIDSATGQVAPLPGASTDGASVISLTSDPQGRFLYAAQQAGASGTTGIGVFAIDFATGLLARGSSIALSSVPGAVIADRSGKAIYVLGDGVISVFSVTSNGPAPLAGSPFPAATVGTLSVITPDGRFLINVGGGQAAVFAINTQTGVPAEIGGSPFPTGAASEQSVAMSPDGKLLFVLSAGATSGDIAVMKIAGDGKLSPVPECMRTSPKTVGCYPPPALGVVSPRQGTSAVPSMVVDSLGHSLYVLAADATGSTRVVRLAIGLSGALGIISSFAQGVGANSIAIDGGGKFLFVGAGSLAQGTLLTYAIDKIPEAVVSSTPGFMTDSNLVVAP